MESKHYQLFRGTRTKVACSCQLRKNTGHIGTQQCVSLVLHISTRNPDWDTWVHPSWCLDTIQTTWTHRWVLAGMQVSKGYTKLILF